MAERNYDLEKELLYKIMAENLEKRFEKTVSESNIDGQYSESFRKKMSRLIGADIKNPEKKVNNVKKYIVAGLIAAVVALAGCAIIGKVLGPYVEEWFNEYILVRNEDDESGSKFIEEIYTLTYVPEGYEYVKEHSSPNLHSYVWKNSSDKLLKFLQTKMSSSFYTDIELGYSYLMENNGVEVYCKIGNYDYSYKWNYDKYCFEILVEQELSQVEIKKIIDGMAHKE
ncbi:MAG: DUF4367 domain-containing protein [Clostridia bacterium]|nr:DUF4367 domain-containing protein [Clostridia bacterium]